MSSQKALFHVGVIITLYNDKGEILLAKRAPFKTHAPNVWENISGALETGEQPKDALQREIREELGESVRYQIDGVYNTFYTKLQNGRDLIGISFLCHYLTGEIKLNNEHTEYKWVSLDEAIKLTKTEGLKKEFISLKSSHPEIFSNS